MRYFWAALALLLAVGAAAPAPRKPGSFIPSTGSTVNVLNWPVLQPVSGTLGINNFPTTQPVSGTLSIGNFPATQPVSGTVTANVGTGTQPVSGTVAVSNLPATQPVSGTLSVGNFPATQPVSGTVTANAGTGTLAVREVLDTARTPVYLEVNNIAAVASEALVSYGGHRGGTGLSAGTGAYVVTTGKVFRLTSLVIVAQGTALATLRVRVRALLTTVLVGSPAYAGTAVVTAANGGGTSEAAFGDGVELPAGFQMGIAAVGATTQTYSVYLAGFEYTP